MDKKLIWLRNTWSIFISIDFVKDKIEEKTDVDLNRDGRIGGCGLIGAAEKATHVDLNRDGVIGGKSISTSGGKSI